MRRREKSYKRLRTKRYGDGCLRRSQSELTAVHPEMNQQRRSQSARKLRLPSLRLKLCCSPRSFARFAYTFFSKPKARSCRCHVSRLIPKRSQACLMSDSGMAAKFSGTRKALLLRQLRSRAARICRDFLICRRLLFPRTLAHSNPHPSESRTP